MVLPAARQDPREKTRVGISRIQMATGGAREREREKGRRGRKTFTDFGSPFSSSLFFFFLLSLRSSLLRSFRFPGVDRILFSDIFTALFRTTRQTSVGHTNRGAEQENGGGGLKNVQQTGAGLAGHDREDCFLAHQPAGNREKRSGNRGRFQTPRRWTQCGCGFYGPQHAFCGERAAL